MRLALEKILFDSGIISQIKFLTMAGDFFDRVLYLIEKAVEESDRFIARLFRECEKHGVILRVLEGTPSHDGKQNNRFEMIYELIKPKVNFKYFDKVDIEHIPELGIDVLYIPDEAHPTTHQTKEVVEALLQAKGLTQVDIAVMHGFFAYQIPHGAKDGAFHDIEFYSRIVRYWITIGHVHTRSRLGKVLAQGSVDRISHGEEGPKGFVMASVRHPDGDDAWFIDNDDAQTYKTLTCTGMEVDEVLAFVDNECSTLRNGSRVRIEAEKTHAIFSKMGDIENKWPFIIFTKLPRASEDDKEVEVLLDEKIKSYTSMKIDRNTLIPLLTERMQGRNVEEVRMQRALKRLETHL